MPILSLTDLLPPGFGRLFCDLAPTLGRKILSASLTAFRAAHSPERLSVRVLFGQLLGVGLAGREIDYGFGEFIEISGHLS
jgi:hypothetical protein